MAKVEDFEIDIEGDFDVINSDLICGADELPSTSVNLLPEYTNPPWMLDQGWSGDHYIDEKSKATIEKMLQEEQHFVNGKHMFPGRLQKRSQLTNHRKPWSEEEKTLFIKGLEKFGENWIKIKELIPSRTALQIRNYAKQYFKKKVKNEPGDSLKDVFSSSSESTTSEDKNLLNVKKSEIDERKINQSKVSMECLQQILQSVTTAQPTIKVTPSKPKNNTQNAMQVNKTKQKTVPRKRQTTSPVKKKYCKIRPHELNLSTPPSCHSSPIQNLDSFCDANGMLQNDSTKITKCNTDDEDIDVDIEDVECPLISKEPHSPDSIYKSLLKSADINESDSDPECREDEKDIFTEGLKSSNANSVEMIQLDVASNVCVKTCDPNESLPESPCSSITSTSEIGARRQESCDVRKAMICDTSLNSSCDVLISSNSDTFEQNIPEKPNRHIVNGFLSIDGEILEFPIPEKELCLTLDEISEEEQKSNSEFFIGKPSKTPDRYKKIRTFILDAWNKCKPNYLNKTSVRTGLKNCGDVNCIGRIHSYLECVGAINFGCDQAIYRNPAKIFHSNSSRNSSCRKYEMPVTGLKIDGMKPRKRRVKDSFGDWVDEKDLEGRTIKHKSIPEERQKSKTCKVLKKAYDPFKLIPCLSFSLEKEAPFTVEIFSSVLSVMDVHAHISKTEVIGLLGGHYEVYTNNLVISMVEPCRSLSTGLQCEMDPVSQIQACQVIHDSGLDIVGWYHSHPNFAPNPSVRDIETQKKFQEWFSQDGSRFVGIIVSPYYNMNIISDIKCLTISQEVVENYNIPYKFDYHITEDTVSDGLVDHITKLADSHAKNHNRIDLIQMYTPTSRISCLQKMTLSLDSHWFENNILELHQTVQELFAKEKKLNALTLSPANLPELPPPPPKLT